MQLLTFPTQPLAIAAERRAWNLCKDQGNHCSAWSTILTDGERFGIYFDESIAGVFSVSELAGVIESNDGSFVPVSPPEDPPAIE